MSIWHNKIIGISKNKSGRMLEHCGDTEDVVEDVFVAWMVTVRPDAIEEHQWPVVVAVVQRVVDADGESGAAYLGSLGESRYRNGTFVAVQLAN